MTFLVCTILYKIPNSLDLCKSQDSLGRLGATASRGPQLPPVPEPMAMLMICAVTKYLPKSYQTLFSTSTVNQIEEKQAHILTLSTDAPLQ